MGWTDFLLRLRAFRDRGRAERELNEELQFHLEMEARKRNSPQAARAAFGGVEQIREECRDIRGLAPVENLARDVRYGLRMLRKSPVFTTVAVLSLAIGIGANTAIFTLIDALLLRNLPVKDPQELVILRWGARKPLRVSSSFSTGGGDGHGSYRTNVFSWQVLQSMRSHSRTLDAVFGFSPLARASIVANGQALVSGGMLVSGNYFAGLGAETLLGRPITGDDETANGLPAVVISYGLWERAFGLNPAVIGKTIYINAQPCAVIGVTPKAYYGVSTGGLTLTPQVDVTLPIRAKEKTQGGSAGATDYFGDDLFWIQAMGRVRHHSAEAVSAELAAILAANLPEETRSALGSDLPTVLVEPGSRGLSYVRDLYRRPLLILMAVVGLTLLMACANLAALLLARTAARRKEILLRIALGARRSRVVRQLLVEGALLAAAGTAAGMALAWWGVRALLALEASTQNPLRLDVAPDVRVLAFTAGVALLTTLLFALAPALRAARVDMAAGIKGDTPGSGSRGFGAARLLLAVQIAAALLLAAGATLFTRTLANLRSVPLGFSASHLVLFDIAPGRSGYDEARGNQFYAAVLDGLRRAPGVTGASAAWERLMSGWQSNGYIRAEGAPKRTSAQFNFVGSDFCRTMQIPIILGRDIESRDLAGPPIAIINETLAKNYFGGGSPIGQRFRWGGKSGVSVEIVGVAKDARYDRPRSEPQATVYAPYTHCPYGWPQALSFAVRTAGDPGEAVAAIRRTVGDLDRMLPLIDVKTMDAQIGDMLAQERLFASLVSLFGAITLALACVGLYGMAASSVAARTREIGIRLALGAGRGAVLRLILGQVAVTAAIGAALGLPATWALTRIVESQLYGVKAHDPASLVLAATAVLVVSLGAALIPARRATRVDPVRALRYE